MRLHFLATVGAVVVSGCVWEVPVAEPAFPVEYPIRHYVMTDDRANLAAWKLEVGEFREKLRAQYDVEVTAPTLLSDSKEVQFLDRAVDPKDLIWRDPSYAFRTPVMLSWWEVIDERGRVQRVFIVASNQPVEMDSRILAWCVNDKLWKPGEIEGSPTITIRSASINLGESRYHIHYWLKRADPMVLALVAIVLITIPVWLVARSARRRREARERHDALLRHVARAPYKAPSIDDPPRL